MKFFLFVIAAGVLLLSGCNDRNADSGTISSSKESTAPITEQSYIVNTDGGSKPPAFSENIGSESSAAPVNTASAQSPAISSPESSKNPTSSSNISISSIPAGTSSSEKSTSIPAVVPEPPPEKEENTLNIKITVNGRTFTAALQDSETAKALKALLPLTLDMSELNGNEKYYYLPDDLPADQIRPSRINAGDIMLYGNSCLVIFYESFSTSYSYTPIGKIDDPAGLASALGTGSVRVTFTAS